MKQKYENTNFREAALRLIATCEAVLNEYISAGYTITVRTLYYQLVSRNVIPNQERSYKNLTGLINDARLAGLLDWDVIEDRGRRPVVRPRWGDGSHFIRSVAPQYHTDMWAEQANRVFVVVEKDALAGVLEATCREYDVPLLAAKGYPSVSSVRDLVHEEIFPYIYEGWRNRENPGKPRKPAQRIVFLHMGDHDPSGLDMSRDLERRLRLFSEDAFRLVFQRIALNMDQIEEQQPPPNPAKVTDSRFEGYQREYGSESWELDALPPDYLNDLLSGHIAEWVDETLWGQKRQIIESTRGKLIDLAATF